MKLPEQASRLLLPALGPPHRSHVHIANTEAESRASGGTHRLGVHLASLMASLHQKITVPKKHICTERKRIFLCHPSAILKTPPWVPPQGLLST